MIASRKTRGLLVNRSFPLGTPAREIGLLIAALENKNFYLNKSDLKPLINIYRKLWEVRIQLETLAQYALAYRGENNQETLSSVRILAGKLGFEAISLLEQIERNLSVHNNVRAEARKMIDCIQHKK